MENRALVTGCQGFVAHAVAKALNQVGYDVHGICRGNAVATWQQQCDFSVQALRAIIDEIKPSMIFQGAGAASVGGSLANPQADFDSSVLCFERLLEAVRLSSVRPHIVFPSSAAIYGNHGGVLHESLAPAPISPYGFHKWQCELLAHEYATIYRLPVTVARLFSVFGSEQQKLIVWEMFDQARREGRIHLRGTGEEVRDYLPVRILAEMIATLPVPERIQVVNVASGMGTKIRTIAETVGAFLGGHIAIDAVGIPIPGDPAQLIADVERLHALVDKISQFVFAEKINDCLESWQNA